MKEIGYGKDYKYAHSYDGNFVADQFLPEAMKDRQFYQPGSNIRENEIKKNLKNNWKDRKRYDD
jgi:putative ATPase